MDRPCHPSPSIAADVSPPGSPLDKADNPPEEDEASFPIDARNAEPNPEYPRPAPGALTGGYVLAEMPRGYPGARRVHLLILQEW